MAGVMFSPPQNRRDGQTTISASFCCSFVFGFRYKIRGGKETLREKTKAIPEWTFSLLRLLKEEYTVLPSYLDALPYFRNEPSLLPHLTFLGNVFCFMVS